MWCGKQTRVLLSFLKEVSVGWWGSNYQGYWNCASYSLHVPHESQETPETHERGTRRGHGRS